MRKLFLFIVLSTFIFMEAQSQYFPGAINYSQREAFNYLNTTDSTKLAKKWSLHKYAGFSASYGFFNGGNASVFSVPVGLQVNRRLNDNLYAFAGISAAPAYVNFSRSFVTTDIGKMNSNQLSMYSRFEAGLMYMNDQKTFSISGSISVERSNYPVYPYYNRSGFTPQQPQNNALK